MSETETTGGKYPRHGSVDVVAAALTLLDDLGLPDLTMRRLAATLDVQPSALYWHFPNKQALLAAVSDQIIARARRDSPRATEWMPAARAEADALRDALLAFRDSAEVVSSTIALGLGAGEAVQRLAAALALGDFEPETVRRGASALLHFILGHVSHEQQRMQADSLGVLSEPHASSPAAAATGASARAEFDFGTMLLLTGMEQQLRRSRSRA
jgi:TetR/AcrR family tetracycline transcriptional repressor